MIRSLRKSVVKNENDPILFVSDVLSQPAAEVMMKSDPLLHHQCSRALPIAETQDTVVLQGTLDEDYHRWLRGLTLSTDNVVCYGHTIATEPLSLTIQKDPERVREAIKGIDPTYLAFYLSQDDIDCAETLGVQAFGCDVETTNRYFDKLSFKKECEALGIRMVEGMHHHIDVTSPLNQKEMAEMVHLLLSNYGKVIIRGTDGSAGRSLYTIDHPDIRGLYDQIVNNMDKQVLIEPFLNVVSSPNDQWAIASENDIRHLGLSAQLFQGLKHAGNFYGQYYSERVAEYIGETSEKIVQQMAKGGYRGVLGIDYIVCEEGIFPIENNARMNGSSFALEFFHKVSKDIPGAKCWKFFKAECGQMTFPELQDRIGKHLFNYEKANSVFPFVTDLVPEKGKFIALLIAEDTYHIDYLQDALSYLGIHRS